MCGNVLSICFILFFSVVVIREGERGREKVCGGFLFLSDSHSLSSTSSHMPPLKEDELPPRVRKSLVGAYTRLSRDRYDADAWGEILKCAGVCDDPELARALRLDYLDSFSQDFDVWEETVRAEMELDDLDQAGEVLGKCLDVNHSLQVLLLYIEYVHMVSTRDNSGVVLELAAHKHALNEVGYDINAAQLWLSYISLLKKRVLSSDTNNGEIDADAIEDVLAVYIHALAQPLRDLDEIYDDYADWVKGMDTEETQDALPTFSVMCEEAEAVYRIASVFARERTRLYEELPAPHPVHPIRVRVVSKNRRRWGGEYTLEENRQFPEIVQPLPESQERAFTNKTVFDAYVLESCIKDEEEKKWVTPGDGVGTGVQESVRSPIKLLNESGIQYELQDAPIPSFGSGTSSLLQDKGFTTYSRWVRTLMIEERLNNQMKEELDSLMSPYYQLTQAVIGTRMLSIYRAALVELRYWPGMWLRFVEYIKGHPMNRIDTTPTIHLKREEKEKMESEGSEFMSDSGNALTVLTKQRGTVSDIMDAFGESILAMPTCLLLHLSRLDYAISVYNKEKDTAVENMENSIISKELIHNLIEEMCNSIPSPLTISEAMFYYASLSESERAYSLFDNVRRHPELANASVIDSREVTKESEDGIPVVQTVKITEEERENTKPGQLILYAPSDPTVSRTSVVPVKADFLVHYSIFLTMASIIKADKGKQKKKRMRASTAKELLDSALKLHSCFPNFVAECIKLLSTNEDLGEEEEMTHLKENVLRTSTDDDISNEVLEEILGKVSALSQMVDKVPTVKNLSSKLYSSSPLYSTTVRHTRWGLSPISYAFLDAEMLVVTSKNPVVIGEKYDAYSQSAVRSYFGYQRALNVTPLNMESQSIIYPQEKLVFVRGSDVDREGLNLGLLQPVNRMVHPKGYDKYRQCGLDGGRYEGTTLDDEEGLDYETRRRKDADGDRDGDDDDDDNNRDGNKSGASGRGNNKNKGLALPANTPAILAALVSVLPRSLDIKQMHLPLRDEFVETLANFSLKKFKDVKKPELDFLFTPTAFVPSEKVALMLMKGIKPEEKGKKSEGGDERRNIEPIDPRAYDPRMERGTE